LEGHMKKITELHFHPTSSNILGTGSADNTVKVWDIEKQAEQYSVELPDNPFSFDWNTNGSLLAITCKNKTVNIVDPRAPEGMLSAAAHAGSKQQSVRWMDNHGMLATVGFTRNSQRQYSMWDPKMLGQPIITTDIDQSAGVLLIHYDPDNSILYVGGKGDGGVKYFEITNEKPHAFFLSEFRTNQPQKGLSFVPKRGLDTKKCEIARCLRLMRDSVVPVQFCVPRKSDIFQRDLYPDTYAGVATQTADDFVAGKNAEPQTMSMNPKDRGEEAAEVAFVAKKSPAELQRELDAANKRIAELEAEVAKLKA